MFRWNPRPAQPQQVAMRRIGRGLPPLTMQIQRRPGNKGWKWDNDLYNTDLYIFITHITSKFQFDRDMMSSQSTGRQILGTLRYPILRQTHMTNRNFFGPKGLLSEFQFAIYFAYISQCLHNLQAIYPVNLGDLHHGNGHNRMMMSSWKSTITRSSWRVSLDLLDLLRAMWRWSPLGLSLGLRSELSLWWESQTDCMSLVLRDEMFLFNPFQCLFVNICALLLQVTRPAPFSSWQVEVIDLCESLPRDESENGDAPSDTQELLQNPEKLAELYARYHMSSHSTMLDQKMAP